MRWPIRYQIFLPFAALVLVAVASIAVTTALLAARRSAEERIDQLHRVESTLADAGFPFTESVLRKMQGLSGAQFVALDDTGKVVTSTFDRPLERTELPGHLPASGPPKRLEQFETVAFAGSDYYAAVLPGKESSGIASLLILYPRENLRRAEWDAAWPPLAVGIATIFLMLAISAWLSGRLSRRIESVRSLFGRIADGQFAHVDAQRPLDEVYDLVLSANRLSDQLAAMRERISRTERLRLLAQLAGGLAHQLRNAATGARMAIQLHQRRCPSSRQDESLDVALRQLVLTEEYIRGLLSLGQQESRPPSVGRLSTLVTEIERLVLPAARHAHVGWTCDPIAPDLDCVVDNSQNVRAGLLNVVLNAVEAAGSGGRVRLWVDRAERHVRVHIADSGNGPPESVRSTLFEPFVTTKPEGVGLGLALAKTVAAEHGGEVSWTRIGEETIFTMSFLNGSSPGERSRDSSSVAVAARNGDRDCRRSGLLRRQRNAMSHVLIVDDEPSICWGFRELLVEDGHEVTIASSAEEALDLASQTSPDAVILDVRLPGRDGLSAIKDLRGRIGDAPIIVVTAFGNLETAVRAVEEGAYDYLAKPFDLEQAADVLRRALRAPRATSGDAAEPLDKARSDIGLQGTLIGSSLAMQAIFKQIALVAASDVPVLITGESGTGKELVAHAIHAHSRRRTAPFLPVSLAALSPGVVESELFGHVRGAFTGADRNRQGLLELADGGTVLLDEIGDVPLNVQVKLLRAIEQREVTPVGHTRARRSDFRVLAATNRPLAELVTRGEFREDLYYRLGVFHIHLPPLRARTDDIPLLAAHFLRLATSDGAPKRLSKAAVKELVARPWHGNVRELRNAVERAAVVARGDEVDPEHFPPSSPLLTAGPATVEAQLGRLAADWAAEQEPQGPSNSEPADLYQRFLDVVEPALLKSVLSQCCENRAAAARILGIHRGTLRQKLRDHGLDDNQPGEV